MRELKKFAKFINHTYIKMIIIVAMAYLLSLIMMAPFEFSLGAIGASSSEDFTATDLFHAVANSRDIKDLDQDIVIVDIKDYTRDEIAEILDLVNLCDPKAVGLDVVFPERGENDEKLISSLSATPNLVMPIFLERDEEGRYKAKEKNFFNDTIRNIHISAANFFTKQEGGIIRDFNTEFIMENGDKTPSLSYELLKIANPEQAAKEAQRGSGVINYPSHEFPVIDGKEVAERGEELAKKIVLLGSLNDRLDFHRTPIDAMTPGVIVHAHALHTMLSGSQLKKCPDYIGGIIAFVLTAFFVWLIINLNVGIQGLVVRILQFIFLYLIVVFGYLLFEKKGIIIDFSYSFLMLAFAFFACDLWNGFETITKYSIKKINIWYQKRMVNATQA